MVQLVPKSVKCRSHGLVVLLPPLNTLYVHVLRFQFSISPLLDNVLVEQ